MSDVTPRRLTNFLTDIIDADLQAGRHTRVATRFPPEPNGYLHIGHAKSICLNFGLALQYGGQCHMRFDDTNPVTEDVEYVDSIMADVRWLGFDWGPHLYFASDYFEEFFQRAMLLVRKGLAYVDEQSVEAIREQRGSLTEPGVNSPHRDQPVEDNVARFQKMRDGGYQNGEAVLRAKIDMASPNPLMRDPLLYRVRHAHHHRTGDAWCIYPMYDYAHCLEDAIEAITHSICTLEFENNRELYDWVIANTEMSSVPRQYEFARLNLGYTVMSKRKLLRLVNDGLVSGWDDPRMPTIAGMRRRGVTPTALRAFAELVGVAKANSLVDIGKFEYCVRDDLNRTAPRVMAVLDPLRVVLTNWEDAHVEWIDAPYWPEDVGLPGTRKLPIGKTLWMEREDFAEVAPKGWHRLSLGGEVRLRHGYVIRCNSVERDANGEVTALHCTYDPDTRSGATAGRKVKGVIHWVSEAHAVDVEARLYERLFSVERPDADVERDFRELLNPDSLVVAHAKVEPSVADDTGERRYQFERKGFFFTDPVELAAGRLVFNRIVTLKDSWAKAGQADVSVPEVAAELARAPKPGDEDRARPVKKTAAMERGHARRLNPALAAAMERLQSKWGLSEDDADLLTGTSTLADFVEAALAAGATPAAVAKWASNDLLRLADEGDVSALRLTPIQFATVVGWAETNRVTTAGARQLLELLAADGGEAETLLAVHGLERSDDTSALQAVVADVLAAHPDEVTRYRAGKVQLLGFLTGQVMKRAGGGADAAVARTLLTTALGPVDA